MASGSNVRRSGITSSTRASARRITTSQFDPNGAPF